MKNLGSFIYNTSWWVIAGSVLVVIIAAAYGTSLFGRLSSGGFDNTSSESYHAATLMSNHLPNTNPEVIVLFSSKTGRKATDPVFASAVQTTLAKLKNNPNIQNINSYDSTHSPNLLSYNHTESLATIKLRGSKDDQSKTFPPIRRQLISPDLNIKVGGQPATYAAFSSIIESDLKVAETISFSLLAVLLVFVFRSFVAAALPLIVGGFAILGAFLVTRLLTNITDISQFAINVIIFLGLGLAIDYSLFMVNRFREELRTSGNVEAAITMTMATAGRTILFSGVTVMISLLSLLVFPLGFLRSMSLGGAAAVLVAMVGALCVLPAVLSRLGTKIYALSFGSVQQEKKAIKAGDFGVIERRSFWYRLSRAVMKRPVWVIVVVLVPLVLTGLPFLHAQLQSADYRSLPKTNEVRLVSESLLKNFPSRGNVIQVVVSSSQSLLSPSGSNDLRQYSQKLAALPQVDTVDGLVSMKSQLIPPSALTAQYASANKKVSVINVYDKDSSYNDNYNQGLVKTIRALHPPASLRVEVGGYSAQLVDLLAALKDNIPSALAIIIGALLIVLFLMLGSVVLPLKAIVLNILSLSASFGTLVWIFQDGHFEQVLGFQSVGAIDANQPVLIFAIAFGLSIDYAVFLLSRIKEQYDRTKNNEEAVAEGIQKTGSIITSAALLLIVVVAAFGTSQIPLMKQLAVGLVLAIAIDALVIRMLLVPAAMKLLGEYNWWAPAPLKRLHQRLGLSE